jgi:NAD(P)-dependent dehydrogenase (short-subunit alcohol dehydrogenase family)
MSNWTTADIPSQSGKFAIVTGATGGLGFDTSLELARADADVVLVGRSEEKGKAAVERIKQQIPNAKVAFAKADLASLASVADFAGKIAGERGSIDLLINNAGVMALPTRQTTGDGFELQFGTNYLSHFALTAHLLPLLQKGKGPRVVNLSSLAHRQGKIDFDDLQGEKKYGPWKAYSQSKLAMLIFAIELQRRSDAGNWGIMSNAAHPGWARTDLFANGPRGLFWTMSGLFSPLFSQSSAQGALPTLMAATSPEARGAGYYGPTGLGELKGPPGPAHISTKAQDVGTGARLWDVSEQITGVRLV